jgi:hypothetical protein
MGCVVAVAALLEHIAHAHQDLHLPVCIARVRRQARGLEGVVACALTGCARGAAAFVARGLAARALFVVVGAGHDELAHGGLGHLGVQVGRAVGGPRCMGPAQRLRVGCFGGGQRAQVAIGACQRGERLAHGVWLVVHLGRVELRGSAAQCLACMGFGQGGVGCAIRGLHGLDPRLRRPARQPRARGCGACRCHAALPIAGPALC